MGNLLMVGSCSGIFYALDPDRGEEGWRYNVSADSVHREFHSDPILAGGLLLVGTDAQMGKPGFVFAFDPKSGGLRWKLEAGVRSDLAMDAERGYAVSVDDELLCFELSSGTIRWRHGGGEAGHSSRASAPVLDRDRVIIAGPDRFVRALTADSGRVIWETDLGARPSTWVFRARDSLWLAAEDGFLYHLDPDKGSLQGKTGLDGGPYSGPVLVMGDSIAVLSGGGSVACFDLRSKRMRWRQSAGRDWSSARPHSWLGAVLVGTPEGELYALDPADGRSRWIHKLQGRIRGIGSRGDTLFVGTYQGRVHALRFTR